MAAEAADGDPGLTQVLASPVVIEGTALRWTLFGLLHQADLEDVPEDELRAAVAALVDAGELVELLSSGLVVTHG